MQRCDANVHRNGGAITRDDDEKRRKRSGRGGCGPGSSCCKRRMRPRSAPWICMILNVRGL